MRVKFTLFFLPFYLASIPGFGQQCNCNIVLKETIRGIEENYAGYFDKVKQSVARSYNKLKSRLLNLSSSHTLDESCLQLLYDYIDYFNDPHIVLRRISNNEEARSFWKKYYATTDKHPLDTTSLKLKHKKSKDSLEGEWTNENGSIVVLVRRTKPDNYEGIVAKGDSVVWFPLNRRFSFSIKNQQAIVYNSVHVPRKATVSIFNDEIVFGRYGRFRKVHSGNNYKSISHKSPAITSYGDSVAYIRLPDFEPKYIAVIDSLITANERLLDGAKFLIVDLIDNTGGSILCYRKLLPYILADTYTNYGAKLRPSLANSAHYKQLSLDSNFPENVRNWYARKAAEMADSLDQRYILLSHDDKVVNQEYRKMPERIFFLVNGKTASAAEMLLSLARQNKKTLILGQTTVGLIDYSNGNPTYELPCPYLWLSYPTGRSNIIDLPGHTANQGFVPDHLLNFNTDKWLEYVIKNFIVDKKYRKVK